MFNLKKSVALMTGLLFSSIAVAAPTDSADIKLQTLPELNEQNQQTNQKVDFAEQKRVTALQIAQQYKQLKPLLARKITADNQTISLADLQKAKGLNISEFNYFNQSVISAKGYADEVEMVELRLADESMLNAMQNGVAPLFAFEPAGDESQWQYIEAFDSEGATHLLDVHEMPKRPVMVVDIDSQKDLQAGVAQMKRVFDEFRRSGKTSYKLSQSIKAEVSSADVLQTTVLKNIRLNDDQEPWISGKAEIYGVVNGVDASREAPELDIVDMPYLDHDDTTYYPNQIVIYWDRYRWGAADMILMEQDDNTNYQDLAVRLLNLATEIMRAIPDATVQGYAIIPQLTSQLIQAMPSHWFTNDDDYVDVLYTLMKDTTYTNHYGASGNAKVTLAPLNIQ